MNSARKVTCFGPRWIAKLREKLSMTQLELSDFLGVHPLTFSRWERGILKPTLFQACLMSIYLDAYNYDKDIGKKVLRANIKGGYVESFYMLFNAARNQAQKGGTQ